MKPIYLITFLFAAAPLWIGATLQTSSSPAGPRINPAHDRAFFEDLKAKKKLPEGTSANTLLLELEPWLASPDPVLRDDLAQTLATRWIRGGLLTDDEMRAALGRLEKNLEKGIGEHDTDSVLLRSFSALTLDAIAARDLEHPFLTEVERHNLVTAALAYLAHEKDLRPWDEKRGWMHATAHTSDLLRHLARNTALTPPDQDAIVSGLEAKLEAVDIVFTHGENRRIAQVLIALLARADCRAEPIEAWIGRHTAHTEALWNTPAIDHALYVRVENQTQLFHEVLTVMWALPDNNACAAKVRDLMLGRR